jgi:5S rRNA maturation endonuclease (ribonuclease M5)|tara:strand:+ start:4151 stop:4540 length:390 start_codon:yes stop_codon:yes gene_type:complete
MNLTKFEFLIEEIKELIDYSQVYPIIVEGPKDEMALRCLGLEGKFFKISTAPFYEVVEKIVDKYSDVILFTDIDKEGQKFANKLNNYFSQKGVRVIDKYRFSIMSLLDVHQVESVAKRLQIIERQVYRY